MSNQDTTWRDTLEQITNHGSCHICDTQLPENGLCKDCSWH